MDYRQQFFEESRTIIGSLSGISVLVAGCGGGLDCQPFVDSGAIVSGIDICENIGHAFSDQRVRYHRQSIEGCELPSNSFDLIFCIATMEHVQNIERAFVEMVRLARPGGTVYSVAAPLWNSRRGHHLDCLNAFPWVHLLHSRKQIEALAENRGIMHDGRPVSDMMEFLFDSSYFNRSPATRYTSACQTLAVTEMLRNYLWLDGEEELSAEILGKLESKGYTRDELLATSHSLICRK